MSTFNPMLLAADNHDFVLQQARPNTSFWADATHAATKGVPSVIASAVAQTLNIPTNIGAAIGIADKADVFNTTDILRGLDDALGTNIDNYYRKHAEAVDTFGYVGASLVPGTVGIKMLRSAQTGSFGGNFIGSTVLGTPRVAERAVHAAKLDILNKGSTFNYINANAAKAIAAGTGQGVLEAAAFETMAALALYSSPHFNDKSLSDIAGDIVKDSLVWGGIFGTLGATTARGDGFFGFRKEVLGYEKTTVDAIRGIASNLADTKVVAGLESNLAAGTLISYLHRDAAGLATKDPLVLEGLISPFVSRSDPVLAAAEGAHARKVFALASKDLSQGIKNLIDTQLLSKDLLADNSPMRQELLDALHKTVMGSDNEKIRNLLVGARQIGKLLPEHTVDTTMPEVFRAQVRGAGSTFFPSEGEALKSYIGKAEAARALVTDENVTEAFLQNGLQAALDDLTAKNINATAVRLAKGAAKKLEANGPVAPEVKAALLAEAELLLAKNSVTSYKLPFGKIGELDINNPEQLENAIAAGTQVAKNADGSYTLIGLRSLPTAASSNSRLNSRLVNGRVVNLKTGEALDFAQNVTAHDLPIAERLGFKLSDLGGADNGLLNKFRTAGLRGMRLADDSVETTHNISLLWADASRMSYQALKLQAIKSVRDDLPYAEALYQKMPEGTTTAIAGETFTRAELGFAVKEAKDFMVRELDGSLPRELIAHRLNTSLDFADNPSIFNDSAPWQGVVDHDSLTHAFTTFDKVEANKFQISGQARGQEELATVRQMKEMDLASLQGDLQPPPKPDFAADEIMLAGGEGSAGLMRAASSLAKNKVAKWAMAATRYNETKGRQFFDELKNLRQPVFNSILADRTAQAELAAVEFWKQGNRGADELGRTKVIYNGNTMFLVRENYLEDMDNIIREAKQVPQIAGTRQVSIQDGKPTASRGTIELSEEDRLVYLLGEAQNKGLAPDSGVVQIKTAEVRQFYETQLKADAIMLKRASKLNKWDGKSTPMKQQADNLENFLYNPPADYAKMPFVFIARLPPGAESSMLYRGQRAVIRARSKEELLTKRASAEAAGYQTFTSKDGDAYFKELGIYDYSESLTNNNIKSDLANKGILNDTLGAETPQEILSRYSGWDLRKSRQATVSFMKAEYGEVFAQLLGTQRAATDEGTSVVKSVIRKAAEVVGGEPLGYTNADRLIDTVLGLPQKGVGRGLIQIADAGIVQTAKVLEDIFTKNPTVPSDLSKALSDLKINDAVSTAVTAAFARRSDISGAWAAKSIGGLNTLISTAMLRLDPLHHAVNIFSTPILQVPLLKQMMTELQAQGKFTPALEELLTVKNGDLGSFLGQNTLYAESLLNNAGPRKSKLASSSPTLAGIAKEDETFAELYVRMGLLNKPGELYRQDLLDNGLGLSNSIGKGFGSKESIEAKVHELWNNTRQVGREILKPADMLDSHTHFASIDAIRIIADKAGMNFNEAQVWMNWFVQHNQGLMTASQKGQLFSGISGSAIGLFQSYQFRIMQRAMEFHEVGDKKALAMMGALQGTIFGATSMPMFDTINRHIVSDGDRRHRDVFTNTYDLVPKSVGDFLLHGAGSSLLRVDMATRAATTPRHLTLAPSSLEDIPAVSILMQTGEFFGKLGSAAANGADMKQASLDALAHNPWNRPLRGVAELVLGYTTTKRGHVNARIGEGLYEDALFEHSQYLRALGGRPLAEATALSTAYRMEMYRQADKDKRDKLAKAFRSHVLAGTEPDDAGFLKEYTRSGGTIQGYNQWAASQYRHASSDRLSRLHKQIKNDPLSQQMIIQLGGAPQ